MMKKNIFTAAFVAAIGIFAGYNVHNAQKTETMSDITLANVEALAGQEWDGDNHCHMDTFFWECLKYTSGIGCYCGL